MPKLRAVKLPAGGVVSPEEPSPQQAIESSALIAQVWNSPALTALTLPVGGFTWPCTVSPQEAIGGPDPPIGPGIHRADLGSRRGYATASYRA